MPVSNGGEFITQVIGIMLYYNEISTVVLEMLVLFNMRKIWRFCWWVAEKDAILMENKMYQAVQPMIGMVIYIILRLLLMIP